jgi:acyl-CoA synthetase (AMP-forming)/AMP-acid ligase II
MQQTKNNPCSTYSRLHEVIYGRAEEAPASLAVRDAKYQLTYGELLEVVESTADILKGLGVRPGDRILLVAENCTALAALVLAASACDAWAVVVNARLSAREIDSFAKHSGARRVFFTGEFSKDARAHAERFGAATQALGRVGTVSVSGLNELTTPEAVCIAPEEQVAAMIYTSGTSGHPKGVMLTHANLLFMAASFQALRKVGPGDIVYGVLPMAHVVGLSSQLLGALFCGATLVLEERFTPERLLAELRNGLTVLIGVPAMYARMIDWCAKEGITLQGHALRVLGTAGAPLTPDLKAAIEAAFGCPLQNGYGLTEMSPTVAQTRLESPRKDCSIGAPIPGVEIRIVDLNGNDVGEGETGELWVRGPNLMKGYYRDADQTRRAVNTEGWFNTGDMARQGSDAALFIVGRTKELIIRSGFNVYPVEVEEVLNSHPSVVQSAVVGRSVQDNEEVVAFIEIASNADLSKEELMTFLRRQLSPYKIPAEIRTMPALPAAPTGKLLKNEMKHLAARPASAPQLTL